MRTTDIMIPDAVAGRLPAVPHSPMARCRGLVAGGTLLVALFIGGFGAWAAYAPLESAAVAVGVVEVETRRKTIQHLEGGIAEEILVRDGQAVRRGEVMLRLRATQAQSTLAGLEGQLWDALAREARLLAEQNGLPAVAYPEELTTRLSEPSIRQVVDGQSDIFTARRALFASKTDLIRQRMAQVREEITGLQAQESSTRKRAWLIEKEIERVQYLVSKGIERMPRLIELQHDMAEVEGEHGDLKAAIARAQQVIAESEISMLNLRNDTQNEIAAMLRDTQQRLFQLREQIQTARDVLTRTEVRAPEGGIVTALKVFTPGAVIAPGEPLLDLVPQHDRLIVKAQIRSEDIDLVRPGLTAEVRLTAYKQRRASTVAGTVGYVSADHIINQRTGEPHFEARIDLDEAAVHALGGNEIVPGMSAEVMIKTGEQTVALYALSPVLDSFHRAFRED